MNKLFDNSIEATDREYILARDDTRYRNQKEFAEDIWRVFSPYADSAFHQQIAAQFHPRFWEMYLGGSLIEMGFELVPPKSSEGPDLHILQDGRDIWIEAIAPDKGRGPDALPKTYPILEVVNVPERQIILRYTHAIHKKWQAFNQYAYREIVSAGDACIIAVNGFKVPYSMLEDEVPYIVKAVLPFGDLTAVVDIEANKVVDQFFQYRREIEKKSGSYVGTKMFLDATFANISAVLHSRADLWNLPPLIGSDFLLVHNPLGSSRLNEDWLTRGRYCWVSDDQLKFGQA